MSRNKSDLVEESYHWWFNDVEYSMVRTYLISLDPNPQTAGQVPSLAGLEPIGDFWLLYVRTRVEATPDRMQQAQSQLQQIRDQLLGVFDFKVWDRRAHDTRIMEQPTQGPA